jgi:TonB-dependent receptor
MLARASGCGRVLILLFCATAGAQTTEPQKPADAEPQKDSQLAKDPQLEIMVIGTRASLQSAIERKKKAGTVVDSIVAEDVAQFPDKNIGEALQRITGIQLRRDFGEGTGVSIRGIEPDLNRVEVNGVSLLGATGGRSPDFRELASELVKSIDVFKGFTADMTEGGIGGTVSIITRRPLELAKPLFSVTASAEYLDTTDTTRPRGNITVANKMLDDRLGFILNVTYDDVDTRGDFLRDTEWVRLADFDSATRPTEKTTVDPLYESFPTFASCAAITNSTNRTACQTQFYDYSPRIPRYGIWERRDKRTSGMATLQYQFTDNLDVWVEGQYNDRNQRLIDNNYSIDLTATSRFNPSTVVTDANHNVIDLYTNTTGVSVFGANRRDFDYAQGSKYYSTGFNWSLGSLAISGIGVHSRAHTDTETNSIGIAALIPNIRVTLDPGTGVPRFTFPTGFDPQSPATYNAGPALQYRPEEIEALEDQAKLDFDWKTEMPLLSLIEFGGQYRKARSTRYAGGGYTTPDGIVVPSANVTTNVVVGPQTDLSNPGAPIWSLQRLRDFVAATGIMTQGRFFDNGEISREGIPDAWLTPGFGAVADYFDVSGFNHDLVRTANGVAQIPAHDIEEKISALYLKANFETEAFRLPLTGNFGVRYTETKDAATGSNTVRQHRRTANGGVEDVTISTQFLSLDNKYRDVLPSFNASLQIRPNLISRLGWAKVLARPKPTDLVPNFNCLYDVTPEGVRDTAADTCTAGNPDLLPYRATQYDLDLGWYPNPDTLLSGALFYKDVKTFVLGSTLVRGVDLFKDGVLYDVRQPISGAGAKLSGAELSAQTAFTFLPKPFNGFGTVLNYTYSKAKDVGLFNSLNGEELGFPGLSKNSYNVILYYDVRALDVRLAYNLRDSWLQDAADRSGNPVIRDGSAYLDGKITYRFQQPEISLFFEAKNLTGETERTTSGDIRLGELSYPGKRYFLGVAFKH